MPDRASSTTSWRISTSSSTSEPGARPGAASLGRWAASAARLRLVHPFPSLLNGLAVGAFALLADAGPPVALRLGLAMTALQFSIGALNDLVDAARDQGRRPPKPVAEGLVSPGTARLVVVVAAALGLGLAAASGPATAAIAAAGIACGYAYDLRLSRTPWAWLPLAIALPLVPVFAWVGATGSVPDQLLVLVPIAMLAGAGLAVGNALADLEVDRAAGTPSIAVRLGGRRAAVLHGSALACAAAGALATFVPDAPWQAAVLAALGVASLGAGVAGVTAASWPDRPTPGWLARLAWGVEAVGIATLGIGWGIARVATGLGAG